MKDDKYMFDDSELERECYHLIALYLASAQVRKLKSEYPNSQFQVFSLFYEKREIKKLLTSISIQLRMIDDLMKTHNRSGYIPNMAVGTIHSIRTDSIRDASLRDACNKVIHAKSLNIITDDNPQVILKGSESSDGDWETTIFILKFIESALELIKSYSEDWDISAYSSETVMWQNEV